MPEGRFQSALAGCQGREIEARRRGIAVSGHFDGGPVGAGGEVEARRGQYHFELTLRFTRQTEPECSLRHFFYTLAHLPHGHFGRQLVDGERDQHGEPRSGGHRSRRVHRGEADQRRRFRRTRWPRRGLDRYCPYMCSRRIHGTVRLLLLACLHRRRGHPPAPVALGECDACRRRSQRAIAMNSLQAGQSEFPWSPQTLVDLAHYVGQKQFRLPERIQKTRRQVVRG